MIQNMSKNKQKIFSIYILIILYYIIDNNITFCQGEDVINIKNNFEQSVEKNSLDYKKIIIFSLSVITIGFLLYYVYKNGDSYFYPDENFDDNIISDIPDVEYLIPRIVKKIQVIDPTKMAAFEAKFSKLQEFYLLFGSQSVNQHLAKITDRVETDHIIFNMDIPIYQTSSYFLNKFYGVTRADVAALYNLPGDSLVAFSHYSHAGLSDYYQIITVTQLIELIEKFNIM
jgi:hypothetical protein